MNEDIDIRHPYKINMLMALTGLALARDADEVALAMLEVIRRFRPDSPRLDSFEGWFCMRRGDMVGATRHLTRAVDVLGAEAGSSRSLLAMVLCAQGDPAWLTHAQAVIDEGVDPSGAFLMKSLRGDDEPQTAPPPDSATVPAALPDGAAVATAAAAQAAPNVDRRMVFLRG